MATAYAQSVAKALSTPYGRSALPMRPPAYASEQQTQPQRGIDSQQHLGKHGILSTRFLPP
jgi:hypothetical protein